MATNSFAMHVPQNTLHDILSRQRWSSRLSGGVVSAGLLVPAVLFLAWYRHSRKLNGSNVYDAAATDPGLLKKHSSSESYTTRYGTYPNIRTFYRPHPNANKLPNDLPLLVFIHGLGGSVAQFAPLLASISGCGPCLAIDFPGCGMSAAMPSEPSAYTTLALAELVVAAIQRFRRKEQKVVLVGHSMGGALAGILASQLSEMSLRGIEQDLVSGVIAICPAILPPVSKQAKMIKRLGWLPVLLFDLLRALDRRGGVDSASVSRFVGVEADLETKRLQLRYNEQSQSAIFLRMAQGMMQDESIQVHSAAEIWSSVSIPVFLIAGAADHVCPPEYVEKIAAWLTKGRQDSGAVQVAATLPADTTDTEAASRNLLVDAGSDQPNAGMPTEEDRTTKHGRALKIEVLPKPASHGLLYAGGSVRILSGLIQGFLARHVDNRLSLGWQLQHLTTSGKWDVKNLAKWQSVDPCSKPIAGMFRAMKTMREMDEHHNPREFVKQFGWDDKTRTDGACVVIDISHESPVYDPKSLEDAGVEYHKFPTVSKLPPATDEVSAFIGLVDRLRSPDPAKAADSNTANDPVDLASVSRRNSFYTLYRKISAGGTIAVHCHYGFNRTGFFIICYLVEKLGWKLQNAIDEFADKRDPGVKHDYFVDELWVRYGVGSEARLQRRNTLMG